MLILNNESISSLPFKAAPGTRLAARLVEEDEEDIPRVFFFILLFVAPFLLAVYLVWTGLAQDGWLFGLGLVLLGATMGGLFSLRRLACIYIQARDQAVHAHLDAQTRHQVIEQALSPGPDYMGRKLLLAYLTIRSPGWSNDHVDRLVRLVQSKQISHWQEGLLEDYLSEHHPGWQQIPHPS